MNLVGTNLGEASHVSPDDVRMWTFQFLDDVKTLVELSEDVRHRAREHNVLRGLLKLSKSTTINVTIMPQQAAATLRFMYVILLVRMWSHGERFLSGEKPMQCNTTKVSTHKSAKTHAGNVFCALRRYIDDLFQGAKYPRM